MMMEPAGAAVAEQRVEFAHLLRGLAAFVVAFGAHLGGLFWQNRPVACSLLRMADCQSVAQPAFVQILGHFNWLGYGHFGVAVFFLISGFVIPFSLDRLRPGQFVVARAFRIFPTYWAALCLCMLVLLNTAEPQKLPSVSDVVLQAGLVRDLAWIGSIDGISWTLEVEIKFYLLCAFIGVWLLRRGIAAVMVTTLALGTLSVLLSRLAPNAALLGTWHLQQPLYGIVQALGMSFLYIEYMLIGTLFNLHYRGSLSGRGLAWGCAAAFLAFVVTWANNRNLRVQEVHGALNYLLALLCFALFYANRRAISTPRILAWLGDISYPLYAVHPIVGYAVLMYLSERGVSPLLATVITLCIVMGIATILHYAIEAPTNRFGKRVAAWSGRKLPRPILAQRVVGK